MGWRPNASGKAYSPSRGDLAFRDLSKDANPFDTARALKKVSDEYLSVLLADNSGQTSAGFRSQLEFELQRRAGERSKTANFIAIGSMAVAALAIIAGGLDA